MSGKKQISNSLTVSTIEDGESAPYYFQEWFAWSNVESTVNATTSPFGNNTEPNPAWSTSIPENTEGLAYLWSKSIRYVWNESTREYAAETAQYYRKTGTNGTSIIPKGTINYAYSSRSAFPPPTSSISGAKAIAKGDNTIWVCRGVAPNTYDWISDGGTASDGFSYTIGQGNFSGTYQSTSNLTGHFVMWSDEATDWVDLGQFKGQNGTTYYTHIAWATAVTLSDTQLPIPTGQTNRPNALEANIDGFAITPATGVEYAWMGYLINTVSSDSQVKQNYTWEKNKGDKGDGGVSYSFVFTKAAARVDENNIVTAELAGYAYKYIGGVRSPLTSTTIRYGYILTDSDTYSDTTTNSSGFFDVGTWFNGDDITDYGKNSPSIFAAIVIGGTVVHAEMITISVKGSTGSRGKVGRFFYFGGTFDSSNSTQTFVVNDAQAPYFEHTVDGQKRYHVFNYDTNGTYTMSQMWAISSNWNNEPWESMTNDFKYLVTEAIFGQFAHLGSFIISGDYFISQYGTLFYNNNGTIETTVINASNVSTLFGGSVAYAWFADSDPMVDIMPTTGNYKFRPTKCIDALSGEEWMAGGNVHVSRDGDVLINGALMYHKVIIENTYNGLALAAATSSIHTAMKGDIFIISRNYSVFNISFPPAYLFPGAMVKINITQDITYSVSVTRLTDEEAEYEDVQGEVYNGFVNALDSTHGNWGVSFFQFTRNQYKSIELVAVENPVHRGYYVWMLIDAR